MENDFKKALNYSFLLLKYRPRAKAEIISRLKRKDNSPAIIEKVVNYLEENNFINDEEFCRIFISSGINRGWGKRKIEANLNKLSVPRGIYQGILNETKFSSEDLRQRIERRIEFYKNGKNVFVKVMRYFISRGFDYQDVLDILDDLGLDKY